MLEESREAPQAVARQLAAEVALSRALGGGYEAASLPAAAASPRPGAESSS